MVTIILIHGELLFIIITANLFAVLPDLSTSVVSTPRSQCYFSSRIS